MGCHVEGEAEISIHSLVKRETSFLDCEARTLAISIHSLVKRETQKRLQGVCIMLNFNPLPRKEGDQFRSPFLPRRRLYFNPLPRKEGDGQKNIYISQAYVISIHSLVKRETPERRFNRSFKTKDFNPLPRKEGDRSRTAEDDAAADFNPLPRKEGDGKDHLLLLDFL